MMKFFDTHSHYDLLQDGSVAQMKSSGLVGFVYDAIDVKTSERGLRLAKKYPGFIYPTLGLHPELVIPGGEFYRDDYDERKIYVDVSRLQKLFEEGKDHFVAVGECGLDHYWLEQSAAGGQLSDKQIEKAKKLQRLMFTKQIEFAQKIHLPLVIHPRGAEEECLEIVRNQQSAFSSQCPVLFHSYTGSLKTAQEMLQAGYYISFNGILTFKNAGNIREIFSWAWAHFPQRILAETDSPYLAPEPKRGERNNPSYVRFVVEKMAALTELPIRDVAATILRNSRAFYAIDES